MNIRRGRIVWTWEPDGWPGGIVTGQPDRHGGFRIEHVVLLPPRQGFADLIAFVNAGLALAFELYEYVTFHLPRAFRLAHKLRALAMHLGFTRYAEDAECEHYVLRRR